MTSLNSNSKKEVLQKIKTEVDMIKGNVDRLEERFDKVQSVDEALVFKQQLLLIESILARNRTEEEHLTEFKAQMKFMLERMKKEIDKLKESDNFTPALDKTVRAVNRIFSTPSTLIFEERKSTNERNAEKRFFSQVSPSSSSTLRRDKVLAENANALASDSEDDKHIAPEEKKKTMKLFSKLTKSNTVSVGVGSPPTHHSAPEKSVTSGTLRKVDAKVDDTPKGRRYSYSNTLQSSHEDRESKAQQLIHFFDKRVPAGASRKSLDDEASIVPDGNLSQLLNETNDPEAKALLQEAVRDKKISVDNHRKLSKLLGSSYEDLLKKSPEEDEKNKHKDDADEKKKKKRLEERNKKLTKALTKGVLEKKARSGALIEDEISWLFEKAALPSQLMINYSPHNSQETLSGLAEDKDEVVKKLAVIALSAAAWPVQHIEGLRNRILDNGLLDSLLYFAAVGELTVHTEVKPSEVEQMGLIAEGASAKVYRAKFKGKDVALKVFNSDHISFNIAEFRRELALLCVLENDNLVPCYGASTQGSDLFFISELMSQGSLCEFLKEMKQFIDLKMILKLARDVSRGMKWLHQLNLIHRDLKSLNLLINKDMTAKIIDFGTSRVVDENQMMTGNLGTPAWIAPEVLLNSKYSAKADVYSFAIVMWEMMTAEEPYADMKMWAIPQAVIEGKRPKLPTITEANKEYMQLMQRCWDASPEKRPSFEELEKIFTKMIDKIEAEEKKQTNKVL